MNKQENTRKTDTIKRVGVLGMLANLGLLVLKFFVGFVSKSQALIADAVNSLGDVLSSLLTYAGGKISAVPEDSEHEFGHGKAEFVASFLIGIIMIAMSVDMIYNSVKAVVLGEHFTVSLSTMLTPVITIIVKFAMYIYVMRLAKQNNSLIISANAKDHRNDMLVSTGVLLGILFGHFGIYTADGIIGAVISVSIALTGIKIVKEAYEVLIDRCIDVSKVEELKEEIEAMENVRHVDSIKSKPTGALHMLIVKISVDPDMTVRDSHKIAGKIRGELIKKPEIYDAVVHINPDE